MTEPKLCKDCRFYYGSAGSSGAFCINPKSRRLPAMDYVHGGERPINEQFHSCTAQRLGDMDCGELGRWFEANQKQGKG